MTYDAFLRSTATKGKTYEELENYYWKIMEAKAANWITHAQINGQMEDLKSSLYLAHLIRSKDADQTELRRWRKKQGLPEADEAMIDASNPLYVVRRATRYYRNDWAKEKAEAVGVDDASIITEAEEYDFSGHDAVAWLANSCLVVAADMVTAKSLPFLLGEGYDQVLLLVHSISFQRQRPKVSRSVSNWVRAGRVLAGEYWEDQEYGVVHISGRKIEVPIGSVISRKELVDVRSELVDRAGLEPATSAM